MRFQAIVKEVLQETPRVRLVRLVWTGVSSFSFRPGQWIGVSCEDFAVNNRPVRRAFSIASVPNEGFVELCIARGTGLSAHLQDLSSGSAVNLDGPYGMFWLRPSKKYFFIAGGTGIAPFMPMINEALSRKSEVLLVYSIKTPSDFIYRKQLEAIRDSNFRMIATITFDGFPNWKGERGRVQSFLHKYFKKGYDLYVCGPPAMVEAVEHKLLELGQPKDSLFVDRWE